MRLLLIGFAFLACGPALPMEASDWTTAQEAAVLLGLPLEQGPAVRVQWGDPPLTLDDTGCRRLVQSTPDPVMLAHELGHALGLPHHPEPSNLMHRFVGRDTTELTIDQHDALWAVAERLQGCP